MNVYVECPTDISKGIGRVRDALKRHVPKGVLFVGDREAADLIVHHVIGVGNLDPEGVPLDERIYRDNRPYAIIQYCLKTTENGGDPKYWAPLWRASRTTWSYYDLITHVKDLPLNDALPLEGFWHAPLGVDDVFRTFDATHVPKLFTVGTSGFVAETEGVLECERASRALGGFHFHLGPDFGLGTRAAHQTGLSDLQVARRWAECHYVAGLRRVEGFETPACEALCVGSRPVVFDAPHYRFAYGDLASYVPEGPPEEVTAALEEVFATPRPVTRIERDEARARFDWKPLVKEFWRRTL